jgi:hypothetical protein
MKKRILSGSMLFIMLAAGTIVTISRGAITRPPLVTKTHQFRCTDKNQSLYFLVYEVNGNLVVAQ